jgi:acetate kinase
MRRVSDLFLSTNGRHNFAALEIVRLCKKELPNVQSITFFDSSFHKSLPPYVKTYPIDQETARRNKLRKYGFHGISYSFILRSMAEYLNKPVEKISLIALHIGSGASVCAIKDGKSVDTSYVSRPTIHLFIHSCMHPLRPLSRERSQPFMHSDPDTDIPA